MTNLRSELTAHADGTACVINVGGIEDNIEAAVDRYVAMTRATQQLVILTSS